MKKLVTVLLLITIFSCALVLVGCTVNKDKNGDQIGQSNTLTTDPIVGKYKRNFELNEYSSYILITKDGFVKYYQVGYRSDNTPYSNVTRQEYWAYNKDTETYELYQLNPISSEKVNVSYYTLDEVKEGKLGSQYTRITDDEWPDCIPEE